MAYNTALGGALTCASMNNAIPPPPDSDPIYKRLYAFARMVEDLLRTLFTPPAWPRTTMGLC